MTAKLKELTPYISCLIQKHNTVSKRNLTFCLKRFFKKKIKAALINIHHKTSKDLEIINPECNNVLAVISRFSTLLGAMAVVCIYFMVNTCYLAFLLALCTTIPKFGMEC
ncbi:hypothetical protein V8G54_026017 [Vigna mungo]|uniref:Uncharacterized protein n=1 Tax=Vigna mungo TaxID=3915 RepID=A0AAQ3MYU8_VIGMU